tara:strand:+ start:755 stop:1333 length:579 start_codon:yes stop_codon:yes gene_type:complete
MKIFRYNRDTVSFEKLKTRSYIKLTLIIVALLTLTYFLGRMSDQYIIRNYTHNTNVIKKSVLHGEPFSEDALIELLKSCNIKYPHIVLAQAKIESANFTSNIFKKNNNLFGMKQARVRVTTSLGTKNNHSYYRDWIDCVYDYAMYQANVMCNIDTEDEYFTKLGDKYAEDSTYVSTVKNVIIKQNLKKNFEE